MDARLSRVETVLARVEKALRPVEPLLDPGGLPLGHLKVGLKTLDRAVTQGFNH